MTDITRARVLIDVARCERDPQYALCLTHGRLWGWEGREGCQDEPTELIDLAADLLAIVEAVTALTDSADWQGEYAVVGVDDLRAALNTKGD